MNVLAFFASGDGIVSKNISYRFMRSAPNFEQVAFYAAQLFIETVHAETYSLIISSLIRDTEERNKLFSAGENNLAVRSKEKWMERFIEDDTVEEWERILAFACSEGIFFTGAFAVIFWIGEMRSMQNLIFANIQISKDEALHCEFAVARLLQMDWNEDRALEIIREAAELEKEFMKAIIPDKELCYGMSQSKMLSYIEWMANRLCNMLEIPVAYSEVTKTPFSFVDKAVALEKINFFEVRAANYKRFNVDEALEKARFLF
ncbi:Ribonucleoside-diphosphate reductase subunit M2 [Galdieria sulphuraria]|nr:Ribonucleoside-diphosphate reductase subunit M2 [Galdieria sulphuraria]